MEGFLLVCLLPVRNGEADLPGYLESVAHVADAVVALDDGSTDRTREILEASPLVKMVLSNPRREGYAGWDDATNRNRLLAASTQLAPSWVLSLDADERIPADDAAALRSFVEAEALPGFAYGFKVYRMVEGLDRYDRAGLWVYRLFAAEPGQRFSDQRLHFVPIPTSIPRERWLRTTIRIQHLASLTDERRAARFAKYEAADPNNEFQHSYRDLLEAPASLQAWQPRPVDLPILDVSPDEVAIAMEDAAHPSLSEIGDRPVLSAVIISRDDGERLVRSVAAVVGQECPWPFEVIVVASGEGIGAEMVRQRFPNVSVVQLPRPALPGEARNAGLRLARGEYVSFPGSHVELPPGSLATRLRAHDLGYAMVTGTPLNGTRTWAGWASYFLDHSAALPGRPSTELTHAPASCSYRRSALLAIGGFPEDMRAGEDTVVNQELTRRGYRAYRAQDITFIHRSPCRTPWRLLRHHFVRGRGYGKILHDRDGLQARDLLGPVGLRLLWQQTVWRLRQTTRNVRRWGDRALVAHFRRAVPLVVAAAVASAAGTFYELLRSSGTPDSEQEDSELPEQSEHDEASQGVKSVFVDGGPEAEELLPRCRIVAYYGHPLTTELGVLGEESKEVVLGRLRRQTSQYTAADASRPALPAFELVTVVAQQSPGVDGGYRIRVSPNLLESWASYAAAEGVLLILDVQPGRSPCQVEIEWLQRWLKLPHVHLAIDAEWAMAEDEVPAASVGCLTAAEIQAAQEALAALVIGERLPPKLLIVHQFSDEMIAGKELLGPVPGVQLVIDADGFGSPRLKTQIYRSLMREERTWFTGMKLFYKKDTPLMTPEQVLAIKPPLDIVIYQ